MISIARPFSVAVRGKPDRYCEVLYVLDKPTGVVYCAMDPETEEQLFIDAANVTKIAIVRD